MAYGTVKVDNITFTNGGSDQTVTVSGIVQSISGNITATGTIQGATIIGTSTVSGATVTGDAGVFTTVTGGSAGFTTVTGTTVTGTTANFNAGTFTSQVSGATVTGNLAQFTTLTGGTAGFTTVTGATVTGTTANFVTVSGTTVTGNAGQFTTITGTSAGFTTITGATITGTVGNFGSGSEAAPSVSVGTTDNGLYSPGTDQVALSTNGTGRLFVDANGRILAGANSTSGASTFYDDIVVTNSTAGTGAGITLVANATNGFNAVDFGDTDAVGRGRLTYSHADDSLRIDTAGTEHLRITSAGLVGIGTSSPGSAIHAKGGATATQSTVSGFISNATARFVADHPNEYGAYIGYANNGTDAIAIQSVTNIGAVRPLVLNPYGSSVGIGTSSPGSAIHAKGGATATQSTVSGFISNATARFVANHTNEYGAYIGYANTANDAIAIQSVTNAGGTRPLLLNPYGSNVGIGSTTVEAKCHVEDTSNTTIRIKNASTSTGSTARLDLATTTGSGTSARIEAERTGGAVDLKFYSSPSGGVISGEGFRLDGSGRLLVGTSSARSNFFNLANIAPSIQLEGNTTATSSLSVVKNAADSAPPSLILAKSRSTGYAVVSSGDSLGRIPFMGADGSEFVEGAVIAAEVDGTPGANDMPGRLVFSVTADGSASPSEAMRINNAGELLVGYTSDNGAYKLQVNSQIFATSAIIATSDGRYKENVAALDGCVDLVKALRPVSFDWKAQEPVTRVDEDGETVVVREAHNFPDGKQVGFIAQEVEEVLADKPWLGSVIKQNVRPAVTDADGNELAPEEEFLGIAEGNLVAVLTSALKDAIVRIESLEAEVAALKA